MIFRNRNFFNSIDNYINKNLTLFELSKSYIEASIEDKIFEKTFYCRENNKKNFLAPLDFFKINQEILDGLTNFQILKPHFCTDIAIYHGDYEADLFIPFYNSVSSSRRVSMIIQKEVVFLGKKGFNVFINEGQEAANISFYSLFMFFVNLYCFDDEQVLETRKNFESFIEEKDSDDLFFYFLMAFKDKISEIKPEFDNLYKNYIDCNYSEDFVNSNKRISIKFNVEYSPKVNLCYRMNIPILLVEDIRNKDFPIEFCLDNNSKKFIFDNSINKIIPSSIKFIGRKSPPIFYYFDQFSQDISNSDLNDRKIGYILNSQREKIQNIFYQNINSYRFNKQIQNYILELDKIYKNNISAIEARKFIFRISDSLLKNSLMVASLS